ncbi:MAG: phosphoribosylanthranilate isomerase [Pseudomonadota bacterium]
MIVESRERRSVIVKVCGIVRLDDALAAVEAGASAIGFNFYASSPRYVAPDAAAAIAAAVPAPVWKAGIFVGQSPEEIAGIARRVGLDIAQLYGEAALPGFRVWRARRVDANFSALSIENEAAEAVLLDAAAGHLLGGAGRTFDWSLARGLRKKIVLAGGLDASNVREAIRIARPWGVDASSRLESAPGRKHHQKIRQFVQAALAETF